MKILFVFAAPFGGFAKSHGYNGGGWAESLVRLVAHLPGFETAVAFPYAGATSACMDGRVMCFPICRPKSHFARIERFFRLSAQDRRELQDLGRIISEFRPSVVHVFGTENCYGLIAREVSTPVVVHLQGLLGPCLNAWVPPGWQMADYVLFRGWSPVKVALGARALAFNRHAARREREIMRTCHAFMGRTGWDRAFVSLYAPQARYFSCMEALRPCFYEQGNWHPPEKPVLVSTISAPLYKGHDMVLKTALMLMESGFQDFEWQVYGISDIRYAERKTRIRATHVHVKPMGVATAEELRQALLGASVYVHPSYIDNSPNSVCEAQILGVPVIATNVGGVASLFSANRGHCLVPANDPLVAASRIREALETPASFTEDVGFVRKRHDPQEICKRVVDIYETICGSWESAESFMTDSVRATATGKTNRGCHPNDRNMDASSNAVVAME